MKPAMIMATSIMFLLARICTAEPTLLETPKDKISYTIGVQTGKNFKKDEVDLNVDLFIKGLNDSLSGSKLLLSDKELKTIMNSVQSEMRKKATQTRRIAVMDNKKKGNLFLEENRKKEGVISLPSGVQYKVVKPAAGKKPADSDTVMVKYRGTLIDGTEFDSTDGDKPVSLKLSQLIPGWKEALKLMPAGSTWQIVVPSQLAYGDRGTGSVIGPNETLIFEVELVAVK